MALTAHSLTTTSGPNYIDLNWVLHDSDRNAQVYYDLAADVWASETSSFEDAELIGEGVTSFRHNALPAGAQRWYWVQAKYIDESPASGGFFPDADISPPAEGIPGEELTGQIEPMVVTDLVTFSGIGHILLKWTLEDPTEEKNGELGFDYVEVWASADNDFDNATLVTTGDKFGTGHFALPQQTTRYYWVRAINKAGVAGDYFPGGSPDLGVEGTTALITITEAGAPAGSWTDFSNYSVTAGSGTFTSITNKQGGYTRIGSTVIFNFSFKITTNGTAGSYIIVGLPIYGFVSQAPQGMVTTNAGALASGNCGFVTPTGGPGGTATELIIQGYNGNYIGQDGATIRGTLIYAGTTPIT